MSNVLEPKHLAEFNELFRQVRKQLSELEENINTIGDKADSELTYTDYALIEWVSKQFTNIIVYFTEE